jgi:antitoxin MazE6
MKTAISIPDNVYKSAEELADRLGKTRSQLYTQALSNYLVKHKGTNLTQKLNTVYDAQNSRLDFGLETMQTKSLPKDMW